MPGSDKLSIINDCLLLKGQNTVAVEDDGSMEWNVCSASYENGVKHLIEEHNWSFGTDIVDLTRTGDSLDAKYTDAYARPSTALHIRRVLIDDYATADGWRILGNKILVNAGGSATTSVVSAEVVTSPGPENLPQMFISALHEWIFAGIESGLKKDAREARAHQAAADVFLARARTRGDQQTPKRTLFKGSLRDSRRSRRG